MAPPPAECECPADPRIAGFYDRRSRQRRRSGERYEPGSVSKTLIRALVDADPRGRTVLELGCGPGALLVELLAGGAARATGIDLSPEAIEEARQRATEAGVVERLELAVGDASRVPLAPHDWVVLDKVICCYPGVDALLANSIPAARRVYAFALPASSGWRGAIARFLLAIEAVTLAVLRRPCPAYVHDVGAIERRLADAGFRPAFRGTASTFWHVAVFER